MEKMVRKPMPAVAALGMAAAQPLHVRDSGTSPASKRRWTWF